MDKTKEPQYQASVSLRDTAGFTRLGITTNWVWKEDPRRLTFGFSRYKFVSKMLEGIDRVLEIGCADAFASRIVRRSVASLTCIDFDPVFVDDARQTDDPNHSIDVIEHDILSGPLSGQRYDAAYAVDVMEHILPQDEPRFLRNIGLSLTDEGILIIGMPSLESQKIASESARRGHVNCKTGPDLKKSMNKFFSTVFLFSMNDEIVHTGHTAMAHYLFALCCNPIDRNI